MSDLDIASTTYLPGSGWVDRPTDPEPCVTGEVTCDIAVIGGGLGA
ncbi:hypothetical protein ACGFQG_27620 [Nocardia fluminea]